MAACSGGEIGRAGRCSVLLWKWGGAATAAVLSPAIRKTVTIPRPIDRGTLERGRERLVKGNSPGTDEELLYVAHRAGFVVQTVKPSVQQEDAAC